MIDVVTLPVLGDRWLPFDEFFLLLLALAMVGFGLACCHLVDLDEKMS
jgi:hypothetical protein